MKSKSVISAGVAPVLPKSVIPAKEIAYYGKNQAGVYVLGSTELGWFKIGQSQDLLSRLGGYRSYPFLIDAVYAWSVEGARCREVEKALHALVENKRIRANHTYSEWFKLDILDIHVLRETMHDYAYFVNSSPFGIIG